MTEYLLLRIICSALLDVIIEFKISLSCIIFYLENNSNQYRKFKHHI